MKIPVLCDARRFQGRNASFFSVWLPDTVQGGITLFWNLDQY
jgi:hypothetical protein